MTIWDEHDTFWGYPHCLKPPTKGQHYQNLKVLVIRYLIKTCKLNGKHIHVANTSL